MKRRNFLQGLACLIAAPFTIKVASATPDLTSCVNIKCASLSDERLSSVEAAIWPQIVNCPHDFLPTIHDHNIVDVASIMAVARKRNYNNATVALLTYAADH